MPLLDGGNHRKTSTRQFLVWGGVPHGTVSGGKLGNIDPQTMVNDKQQPAIGVENELYCLG